MALTGKKYNDMYSETSSDDNGLSSDEIADLQSSFNTHEHIVDKGMFSVLKPVLYQIKLLQEEIDYLRTEISANKDKATFPGFGTSSGTALAGDTTTITTAQANAITANTAKAGMVLGTTNKTALAGDTTTISTAQANEITASTTLGTKLNVVTKVADANKSTAITFGEFTTTVSGKTTTYSIPITVVETDTSGKSTVTTTKTGSITLT